MDEAIKGELKDVKLQIQKVENKIDNLVTTPVCEATQKAITEKVRANQAEIIGAIQAVRSEVVEIVNGKVEREITKREKAPQPPSVLERMANVAKSVYAIIVLGILLVGGCVASSYYIAGAMNVLKQAAAQTTQATQEQKKIIQEQKQMLQQQKDPDFD